MCIYEIWRHIRVQSGLNHHLVRCLSFETVLSFSSMRYTYYYVVMKNAQKRVFQSRPF